MNKPLSKRLFAVTTYLKGDDYIADIGSDHGYLVMYLAEHQLVRGLYASENKLGPFQRLKANIIEAGLEHHIHIAFKDGLEDLPEKVDTLILTGLGGEVIYSILKKGQDHLHRIKKIILSPQSHLTFLRARLGDLSLKIISEEIIEEEGHYYLLMVLTRGEERLTALECEFGPRLLKERPAPFLKMINEEKARILRLLKDESLPKTRINALYKQIKKIDDILGNEDSSDD